MIAILLGICAALGTLAGLFVGMPAVGFVLWPITRAVCRACNITIDPHDHDGPVLKLEGSLAAGLGMALGVAATVAVVGLATFAPRALWAAAGSGCGAGFTFGVGWQYGYRRQSAAGLLLGTAMVAAAIATLIAW